MTAFYSTNDGSLNRRFDSNLSSPLTSFKTESGLSSLTSQTQPRAVASNSPVSPTATPTRRATLSRRPVASSLSSTASATTPMAATGRKTSLMNRQNRKNTSKSRNLLKSLRNPASPASPASPANSTLITAHVMHETQETHETTHAPSMCLKNTFNSPGNTCDACHNCCCTPCACASIDLINSLHAMCDDSSSSSSSGSGDGASESSFFSDLACDAHPTLTTLENLPLPCDSDSSDASDATGAIDPNAKSAGSVGSDAETSDSDFSDLEEDDDLQYLLTVPPSPRARSATCNSEQNEINKINEISEINDLSNCTIAANPNFLNIESQTGLNAIHRIQGLSDSNPKIENVPNKPNITPNITPNISKSSNVARIENTMGSIVGAHNARAACLCAKMGANEAETKTKNGTKNTEIDGNLLKIAKKENVAAAQILRKDNEDFQARTSYLLQTRGTSLARQDEAVNGSKSEPDQKGSDAVCTADISDFGADSRQIVFVAKDAVMDELAELLHNFHISDDLIGSECEDDLKLEDVKMSSPDARETEFETETVINENACDSAATAPEAAETELKESTELKELDVSHDVKVELNRKACVFVPAAMPGMEASSQRLVSYLHHFKRWERSEGGRIKASNLNNLHLDSLPGHCLHCKVLLTRSSCKGDNVNELYCKKCICDAEHCMHRKEKIWGGAAASARDKMEFERDVGCKGTYCLQHAKRALADDTDPRKVFDYAWEMCQEGPKRYKKSICLFGRVLELLKRLGGASAENAWQGKESSDEAQMWNFAMQAVGMMQGFIDQEREDHRRAAMAGIKGLDEIGTLVSAGDDLIAGWGGNAGASGACDMNGNESKLDRMDSNAADDANIALGDDTMGGDDVIEGWGGMAFGNEGSVETLETVEKNENEVSLDDLAYGGEDEMIAGWGGGGAANSAEVEVKENECQGDDVIAGWGVLSFNF